MFTLFVEGGAGFMTILTLLLVGIFFAAWKSPRRVKEIGAFALIFGFFSLLLGLRQMFTALQELADELDPSTISGMYDIISPGVLLGGLKVAMIPVLYGTIIYMVSLIVRAIQKPRL